MWCPGRPQALLTAGAKGWRRGEGGRAGYAPHYATRERNHRLATATGSLPVHEAPRFGRLRLPQLERGFPVTAPLSVRTRAAAAYFYGHYDLGT